MKTPIPGGLLVALEGIDGTGKSTVAATLAQWCGERGLACVFSREPTNLSHGRKLRESMSTGRLSLEEELELFRLDRKEHIERSIGPALAENQIVILDRYYWSNAAYQGARGADVGQIIAANEAIAPVPDLILWMDIDVSESLARIHGRGDIPNGFEARESLEKTRAIYTAMHERGDRPSVRIDASRDLRTVSADALRVFTDTALRKIMNASPILLAEAGGLFQA
ncbi:MAG: dTMP kinase [Chthoniobacteraceae bacterium]|nr:dTMP kinase [Chthoniobacteraceae bacterium]